MIEVNNLVKRYGAKVAVDHISFRIDDGEVVGFLGPNGAGKSTTMNVLTGYISSTDGSVKIDGYDVLENPAEVKRRIGFLPENPPLYMDMTVNEYLRFACSIKGVRRPYEKHISDICELVGIAHVRKRLIRNLSKGYKQRTGLAQALIGNPSTIILDEPTVGLDPTQIIEIRTLIEQVGKEHTVILSSHILSEIQAVCERVIVLNEGRLVADDTPSNLEGTMQSKNSCVALVEGEPEQVLEALRSAPSVESVERLGLSEPGVYEYRIQGHENADIRRDVFNVLSEAHLPLLGTRSAHVTLEDVFLRLVGVQAAPQAEEDAQAAPQTEGEEAAEE